jgi:hypothetical protein
MRRLIRTTYFHKVVLCTALFAQHPIVTAIAAAAPAVCSERLGQFRPAIRKESVMKRFDVHRYDMLLRVSAFGATHRDLFPASALGGRMFTALASAVRQLNGYVTAEASGDGATREGAISKAAAREALRQALVPIAGTARALALDTPGLEGKFRLRKRCSDHDLALTARTFIADGTALSRHFVAHGLPGSFVADLRGKLEAFERSARDHVAAAETRVIARAGIESAMEAALTALQRLDAVVPNRLRDNPTLHAAWTSARRTTRMRMASAATAPTLPPVTVPVVPPPPVTLPAAAAARA